MSAARRVWTVIPALLVCSVIGLASAKLPAPPPTDPAKAGEAKKKTADAAKKSAEQLAKAQDRAAENHKKTRQGTPTPVAKKK